jgi:hypothetical protein
MNLKLFKLFRLTQVLTYLNHSIRDKSPGIEPIQKTSVYRTYKLTMTKIVFLDQETIGKVDNMKLLSKLGNLVVFESTEPDQVV